MFPAQSSECIPVYAIGKLAFASATRFRTFTSKTRARTTILERILISPRTLYSGVEPPKGKYQSRRSDSVTLRVAIYLFGNLGGGHLRGFHLSYPPLGES